MASPRASWEPPEPERGCPEGGEDCLRRRLSPSSPLSRVAGAEFRSRRKGTRVRAVASLRLPAYNPPVNATPRDIPDYCSFCGKDRNEVRKLIAGGGPNQPARDPPRELPPVCICDECVELCFSIVAETFYDEEPRD
jgi:hypothetical protein